MKGIMQVILTGLAALVPASIIAYIIWCVGYPAALRLAPESVWWWKPVCLVVIGYLGGIGLPLTAFILSFICLALWQEG